MFIKEYMPELMAVLVVVFAALIVVGGILTSSEPEEQIETPKAVNFFIMENGLECVRYSAGYRGNVTCNWEKFNG